MIVQELRAEFAEYFQAGWPMILWLDPRREWEGVVPHLAAEFDLVRYEGSQLAMKAEVELAPEGARRRWLLYVPLRREDLTVLKEYEFSARVFDESLLSALRRWGVEIQRDDEKELVPLLPILARHWAKEPLERWRNLTPGNARARLFDDEQVREILENPEEELSSFEKEGWFEIFADYVSEQFGLPRPSPAQTQDWARDFTAGLILTEVFVKAGCPEDFPFIDRLPAPPKRERCLAFLRGWINDNRFKDGFKRLAEEAESRHDLGGWAARREGDIGAEASLTVEKGLLSLVVAKLKATRDFEQFRRFLLEGQKQFATRKNFFWVREGEVPGWRALELAADIVAGCEKAIGEVATLTSAGDFARRYVEGWWRIDQRYREYRARFDTLEGMESLAGWLKKIYRDFQEKVGLAFSACLASQGGVKIPDLAPQAHFWEKHVTGGKRCRAILIVDALRYELGRTLAEHLQERGGGAKLECTPMVAATPTITPVGMAYLVAGSSLKVSVEDGKWHIEGRGRGGNLADSAARREWIQARYPKVAFYGLSELLQPEVRPEKTGLCVIFSDELDEAGHSGVLKLTPEQCESYLERCERAIRKLGAAGFEEAHVITDHGFYLLDSLDESDIIPVASEDLEYKGHRAMVAKKIEHPTALVFDLLDSEGWLQIGFPRGVGCFKARGPYQFFHGGVSLQELIVPHIRVRFPRAALKYDVKIVVPTHITTPFFEIELRRLAPVAESGQVEMQAGPRFVEVVGHVMKEGKPAREPICRATGAELVIDDKTEGRRVKLRLVQGVPFEFGDTLRLVVRDADSGAELDAGETTLRVEPDL